jgi:hypothetical protein
MKKQQMAMTENGGDMNVENKVSRRMALGGFGAAVATMLGANGGHGQP